MCTRPKYGHHWLWHWRNERDGSIVAKDVFFWLNTLRPRQNGRHFADDIFKCILLNENVWITPKYSLKFVPKGPINNIPELVQIMAWRRRGDKPLSEPMLVSSPTHICITRPQWVNIVTLPQIICDVAQTRGTNIVTSYSSIVLARANWCKVDLH